MTWRVDCGGYTLYVIEDGFYWRDPTTYYPESSESDWRFHQRNEEGKARLNFGCYLITDGDQTIMVDSGVGENSPEGMTTGLMPAAVDALGVSRDSVQTVIYTHMHFDHIGGSQRGGEIVFPNARHLFHPVEWDHWKNVDSDFGIAARRIMTPLFDAGVVDFSEGKKEVLAGITVFETPGHTPGHVSVSVSSAGTTTLVGGDISNHPFQVEHPQWSLPVDNDYGLAGTTRDGVFDDIKDTDTTFIASHYPMPGVGRIVTDDGTRSYQPISAVPV